MNVDYPYQIDGRGRTADAGTSTGEHLRDLIEQVLMTAPGERVMRPDFGSGLLGLIFEPGGPEAIASTQYLVQSALTQWLGHLIAVESVDVTQIEGTLTVAITYVVIETQNRRTDEFLRSGS